jgi:hypothetical protein
LRRLAPQRDGGVVAGLERRHGIERCGEGQGPAFFNRDVPDIRRVHRLDASLTHRVVHGARNEIVGDVIQDLVLETLLDYARRGLPRTESGNARLGRIVERDAVDLRVHHIGGNLDPKVLAGLVDVDEISFHPPTRLRRFGATSWCESGCERSYDKVLEVAPPKLRSP